MAWDTERTRALLIEAATTHFAQRGLAGTRVDAVARDAGVNKERIYQYFGNKEGLFEAALTHALECFLTAVPLEGEGASAIGEFAGCLHDEYADHPALPRLLAWEGLERGVLDVERDARARACRENAAMIQAACPSLGVEESTHLLLTVVSLATAYWTLPQLSDLMLGTRVEQDVRRTVLVTQITAMASALAEGPEPLT